MPRADRITLHALDAAFVDALAERAAQGSGRFELVRSGGHLYATCDGVTLEAPLVSTEAQARPESSANASRRSGREALRSPPMTAAVARDISTERRDPGAEADALTATLARMKAAHRSQGTPTCTQRLASLDRLERALLERKDALASAIARDFGNRSKYETLAAEIFVVLSEIRHARSHVREWMRPQPRDVGIAFIPATAEVVLQPLGVVGIISPWNYPVQLALAPLVGVLAAGNRAMIKPSELVPETAEVLAALVADAFPPDQVTVVRGGADVGEAFSRLPFDHLVFTGSTRVGKVVMRAAAENLVPVTLELGGKSPVIVGGGISARAAAEKIMTGKCFNAGQTCVAPDYALVARAELGPFVAACEAAVAAMYPTLAANPDYTSIINDRHYARLRGYLDEAKERGAKVLEINPAKETLDSSTRKFPPTLIVDPPEDLAVMQEEIFGPILPIKTYGTLNEAIDYVNDRPRPLALYYLGYDEDESEQVVTRTIAGGMCINETVLHVGVADLPFGGVGPSGMGHYHGVEGFETFSKKKPIFRQSRLSGSEAPAPAVREAARAPLEAPHPRVMVRWRRSRTWGLGSWGRRWWRDTSRSEIRWSCGTGPRRRRSRSRRRGRARRSRSPRR